MKFPRKNSSCLVCMLIAVLLLTGCGGGGGSGASTRDGIALSSITFPTSSDWSSASSMPPVHAPLSQQIVFTFTGKVKGDITMNAFHIFAEPGSEYQGPEIALNETKNIIEARGILDVIQNVVIFTPYIPSDEIDLSPDADPSKVPGLLPGFQYSVFVPVGVSGSIDNLVDVHTKVNNPLTFATVPEGLSSLYFMNMPSKPPDVVSTEPTDGETDFPVNVFSAKGFPAQKDIVIEFDQPLDFSFDNLEGEDRTGNGVRDQNIYLEYNEPAIYMAVNETIGQAGYLGRMNFETGEFQVLGETDYEGVNVGLAS
ncbi:MAG: hypothetical protein ACYTG7_20985, partial [Planctomycetota bacterium]